MGKKIMIKLDPIRRQEEWFHNQGGIARVFINDFSKIFYQDMFEFFYSCISNEEILELIKEVNEEKGLRALS